MARKPWNPSCEQAKFVAQASRLIGLGFFAAVGYHDAIALVTGTVHGTHVVITAFFAFLVWLEFELIGYLSMAKEGVNEFRLDHHYLWVCGGVNCPVFRCQALDAGGIPDGARYLLLTLGVPWLFTHRAPFRIRLLTISRCPNARHRLEFRRHDDHRHKYVASYSPLLEISVTAYSLASRSSANAAAASRSFCSCILSRSSSAWEYARSASSGVHSGSSDGGIHPLGLRPRGNWW